MSGLNLPDVSDAFSDISAQVKLRIVAKAVHDFEIVEAEKKPETFYGVLTPLPQKLDVKPEGQRKWKAWALFTRQELELDWMIEDPFGKKFRVFDKENWGLYTKYVVLENPLT